ESHDEKLAIRLLEGLVTRKLASAVQLAHLGILYGRTGAISARSRHAGTGCERRRASGRYAFRTGAHRLPAAGSRRRARLPGARSRSRSKTRRHTLFLWYR